jgi:hypothetical protein
LIVFGFWFFGAGFLSSIVTLLIVNLPACRQTADWRLPTAGWHFFKIFMPHASYFLHHFLTFADLSSSLWGNGCGDLAPGQKKE